MCFSRSLAAAACPSPSCSTMTTAYEGRGAALPWTLDRNRPDLVPDRPRTYLASMDILTDVLDRVRLKGTVLFHYEFGRPWSVALPRSPDAIFHYLSRGSASIALEDETTIQMAEGDFVLIVRASPTSSGRVAGRSLSRWSISIGGQRMSASSTTAVGESRFRR